MQTAHKKGLINWAIAHKFPTASEVDRVGSTSFLAEYEVNGPAELHDESLGLGPDALMLHTIHATA